MVSAVATNHLRCQMAFRNYDFDPDSTNATDVAWVPMKDFASFMATFTRTIGAGNLTGFKILANSQPDGSGTDVEVKVHPLTDQPNALMDQIHLECSAEEIAHLGEDLAYVSANIQFATATDEGVVSYHRGDPRYKKDGLTADIVA